MNSRHKTLEIFRFVTRTVIPLTIGLVVAAQADESKALKEMVMRSVLVAE